jgi:hypothetical protein
MGVMAEATRMEFADKALFHQIHPAKLATDIMSSVVSVWLLCQHQLLWGVAVTFVPPAAASALVIRFARLEPYRDSRFGRYVARIMTPATQGVRLLGALVMALGAWGRSWPVVAVGLVVVVAAWSRGLLRPIG